MFCIFYHVIHIVKVLLVCNPSLVFFLSICFIQILFVLCLSVFYNVYLVRCFIFICIFVHVFLIICIYMFVNIS